MQFELCLFGKWQLWWFPTIELNSPHRKVCWMNVCNQFCVEIKGYARRFLLFLIAPVNIIQLLSIVKPETWIATDHAKLMHVIRCSHESQMYVSHHENNEMSILIHQVKRANSNDQPKPSFIVFCPKSTTLNRNFIWMKALRARCANQQILASCATSLFLAC